MKPYFSIIIPTYNRAEMVERAINSVLSQSYQEWEMIVVNDGSTDNTSAVLKELSSDQILIVEQENSGKSQARNNGLAKATGDVICFLDDDDWFLDNHLEELYQAFQKFDAPIIKTGVLLKKPNGEMIEEAFFSDSGNIVKKILEKGVSLFQLGIKHEILKSHLFDTKLPYGQDSDYILRLLCQHHDIIEIKSYSAVINDHEKRSTNSKKISEIKSIRDCALLTLDKLSKIENSPFTERDLKMRKKKVYKKYYRNVIRKFL